MDAGRPIEVEIANAMAFNERERKREINCHAVNLLTKSCECAWQVVNSCYEVASEMTGKRSECKRL